VEIRSEPAGEQAELAVQGRVDSYWAADLAAAIEAAIRQGARRLSLDLSEVTFLSSAGIGVLVRYQQQLEPAGGSLVVTVASPLVKKVLEMARLGTLLLEAAWPQQETRAAAAAAEGPAFRLEEVAPGVALNCQTLGRPEAAWGRFFQESDCGRMIFPATSFGLGVGAFGRRFEDCAGHLGEFLALGGAAAYQPSDGSNVPDYRAAGAAPPELMVLYGVVCEGAFSHRGWFQGRNLGELAGDCLDSMQAALAGVVLLAETAGPAPELILAAGILARAAGAGQPPLLEALAGRFHAARFWGGCPEDLPEEAGPAARAVFESQRLKSVGRLAPETRFRRGRCWAAAVRTGQGQSAGGS